MKTPRKVIAVFRANYRQRRAERKGQPPAPWAVNLRAVRENRGLSSYDVAALIKIHPSTIGRIERAEIPLTAEMLQTLCDLYGSDAGAIMAAPVRVP